MGEERDDLRPVGRVVVTMLLFATLLPAVTSSGFMSLITFPIVSAVVLNAVWAQGWVAPDEPDLPAGARAQQRTPAFRPGSSLQPSRADLERERRREDGDAPLDHGDGRTREGDVRNLGSPIVVWATGLSSGGLRGWLRRHGERKRSVLDLASRNRHAAADGDRRRVLTTSLVASLVGAGRGRITRGGQRDRYVAVPK